MNDSLKDQLIALGLAREEPGEKHHGKKRGESRSRARRSKARAAGGGEGMSLESAWRLREREERDSREKEVEARRREERRRRRLNRDIQALVEGQAQNDSNAELKRNFIYKEKIRSVAVNAAQLAALNEGRLALVFLRGNYLVVAPELADQVRDLSPEHVPNLAGGDSGDGEHPVPDDLTW